MSPTFSVRQALASPRLPGQGCIPSPVVPNSLGALQACHEHHTVHLEEEAQEEALHLLEEALVVGAAEVGWLFGSAVVAMVICCP